MYLAVILDLFARRAVGYAISRNIDTVLCLEALQMAIENRRPTEGILHHSDCFPQLHRNVTETRLPDQRVP